MKSRRLIIADPGLAGLRGHHFGYSGSVAAAAERRGISAVILTAKSYCGTIGGGRSLVEPRFSGSYQSSGGGGSARRVLFRAASYFPSPFAGMVAPPLRSIRRRISGRESLSRVGSELASALEALGSGDDDVVLLHSVSAANLEGVLDHVPPVALGRLLVVLRRSPEEMDAEDAASEPIASVLRGLAGRFGARLRLFADTRALAARFAAKTELAVTPVQLPIVVPPTLTRPVGDPPRIVFPGGARLEKGYQRLPALVRKFRERARFTVHSGPVGAGDDPLVQRAHRALRRLAGPRLCLIEEPLKPQEYQAVLASADLLLLPYDGARYGPRSSGVLGEGLALGVPSIVPAGCWMSDVVRSGTVVAAVSDVGLPNALAYALAHLDALSTAARAAAGSWRAVHNPDALLDTLLQDAGD